MRYIKQLSSLLLAVQFGCATTEPQTISADDTTKVFIEAKVRTVLKICHFNTASAGGALVDSTANCSGGKYQLSSIERAENSMGWELLFVSAGQSFHHDEHRSIYVVTDHNGAVITVSEK